MVFFTLLGWNILNIKKMLLKYIYLKSVVTLAYEKYYSKTSYTCKSLHTLEIHGYCDKML